VGEIFSGKREVDSISCARHNARIFQRCRTLRDASAPRSQPPTELAKFSRGDLRARVGALFLPLPWNALTCIPTTTGRHLRHAEYKILWFLYEFFLTSFPQPPILRFQARGRISWPQRFLLPPTSRRAGPGLTENLKGPYPTARSASVFLRRLAGLLSLFSVRTVFLAALKSGCSPQTQLFVYQYGALHFTLGAPLRSRMKVLLPHGSPAHMQVAPLPARRQNG
jgi:hypothetical protein